jgi:hypothetical protein
LSTNTLPVGQTILHYTNGFLAGCSNRIIKPDPLNEATVAAIARISGYDVEKWALFGASTS